MKLIRSTVVYLLMTVSCFAFEQSHRSWDGILSERVKGNKFDYAGLKTKRAALDAYVESLSKVAESDFKSWGKAEQLAFLINLYNAATVKLIVDHYPVKSIREIGGEAGPWKMPVVSVFGKMVTLDHVEHQMIRENFAEPRIHFAVNCASIGCPALRGEAYTGAKLDGQLEDQTKDFLGDRSINRLRGGTLQLSPLFDWFKDDFVKKSGSVENFVAPYFPRAERAKILGGVKVRFGDYDWSLNGR